jgi:hypothetical protein
MKKLSALPLWVAAMAALLIVASCDDPTPGPQTPAPSADVTQPSSDVSEQPISCGPNEQKADDGHRCVPLVEPPTDCSIYSDIELYLWTCDGSLIKEEPFTVQPMNNACVVCDSDSCVRFSYDPQTAKIILEYEDGYRLECCGGSPI